MTAVFEEYRRFADPKSRFLDQQFIELFDINTRALRAQYAKYEAAGREAIVRMNQS
jgi:hypothetical protein